MSPLDTPRDEATQRQIDAAQPGRSTWLSANAGSGKTRVLTDRVARLLLDGVHPQNVLCLTYTKAAASEMQNRLFRRLGEWAMLPDEKLRKELHDLGVDDLSGTDRLRRARRLFASAIETPGGLKIQTIHSFCAALLRRFPLEAGVSPQFTEIDERSAALLQREVLEELAESDRAPILQDLARQLPGTGFEPLIAQILNHRDGFGPEISRDTLCHVLGVDRALNAEALRAQVFLGNERALFDRLIPALLASGPTDQRAGHRLANLTALDLGALPELESLFLFGSNAKAPFAAKVGKFPTKDCAPGLADILPQLEDFMRRTEAARGPRLALETLDKSLVLHRFARVFLDAYEEAKTRAGWLDFDDLIACAHRLLTDPAVAAWVLFRIDGGIDHILVDEAQDTSPLQWKVIERLAQEFTSGAGARPDVTRTIFVVGDKKQSIYSFQGADPREFDRMRQDFAARLAAAETPLQDMQMEYSFRSSQAILSVVDATFRGAESSGFTQGQDHRAFHADLPGRVDLWPVVEPPERPEEPAWNDPVDVPAANHPEIELANKISLYIKELVETSHPIPEVSSYRPVRPGDFLILVQRRNMFFHEVIAACKRVGLPVAGADRLKVGGELAVRDIAALLAFLATPEDDLSLACCLRSPLFGWSEAQLYDLAHHRESRYLWAALRERRNEFPETLAILDDLRAQADYLRPFELIERILTRHKGRRRLLARLGTEAEDGIDALLSQALIYERKSVDSLTGFLVWLQTDDMEIKRQMDDAGDQVRVMTVHGSKGLESPIVVLPDTARRRQPPGGYVMPVRDVPMWRTSRDDAPAGLRNALEEAEAAVGAERDRLLYVAMTRAEKWLIVAASGDIGDAGQSWYRQVETALAGFDPAEISCPTGTGQRYQRGVWPDIAVGDQDAADRPSFTLEPHFSRSVQNPAAPASPLSPSDLGGAKALPSEDGLDSETAMARGDQIHKLLELLPMVPADDRDGAALRSLPDLPADLLTEVRSVLNNPGLAYLFAPTALAEVPVTADLADLGNRRIHGVIDRLIIRDTHILAVDFKSNAAVPASAAEVPEGLLRQMGAYLQALKQIYPEHQIEVALLWTRTATLMTLPHETVIAALKRTAFP